MQAVPHQGLNHLEAQPIRIYGQEGSLGFLEDMVWPYRSKPPRQIERLVKASSSRGIQGSGSAQRKGKRQVKQKVPWQSTFRKTVDIAY